MGAFIKGKSGHDTGADNQVGAEMGDILVFAPQIPGNGLAICADVGWRDIELPGFCRGV